MSKISVQKLLKYELFLYENTMHDIKTPLMLAMTLAKALDEMDDLPELASEYISKIVIQLGKMNRVFISCAEETKLLSSSLSVRAMNCDILLVLQDAIDVSRTLAEQKGVYVKLQTDVFYTMTSTNRDYLDKILTNLLSNAIKYSDPGKTVTLSFKATKKNLILSVKDEGEGIPKEKHLEIFKRYYTSVDAKNPNGTGIGLSIVKEYTKRIGGKITVYSEIGKGTIFKLTIPRIYSKPANDEDIVTTNFEDGIINKEKFSHADIV